MFDYKLANLMKSLITAVATVALFTPFGAFAYELPHPISVGTSTPAFNGSGEVDLTRASSVEGSIYLNSVNDESAWVTAGDVASGGRGYGFLVHEEKLFGVVNTTGVQYLIPIGYVRPNVVIHLKADYTLTKGVVFHTASNSADWNQYSLSVLDEGISWQRGLGAFNASITNKNSSANLFVQSWKYQ